MAENQPVNNFVLAMTPSPGENRYGTGESVLYKLKSLNKQFAGLLKTVKLLSELVILAQTEIKTMIDTVEKEKSDDKESSST